MERLTRTVLRTLTRRGKSDTPLSRVSTDDSRNLRDVRREETQSEYVERLLAAMMTTVGCSGGYSWGRLLIRICVTVQSYFQWLVESLVAISSGCLPFN